MAAACAVAPASFVGWRQTFRARTPVSPVGYRALALSFHPGSATGPRRPRLSLRLNDSEVVRLVDGDRVRLLDLSVPQWQTVEVSLADFAAAFVRTAGIESVSLEGNLTGTFYLDDVRLVAARPSRPGTAVLQEHTAVLPQAFGLQPNYRNPFNGSTVIRFRLPASGPVELAVYNLAGQKVATLVRGERQAGTHAVTWEGRDDDGRPLASGVYLCGLRAGGEGNRWEQTRKLVLVR
ncbi:MAG: FlgD immunoglobulin-like domain containing protein [Candidatus Latescibacterota bacterium]